MAKNPYKILQIDPDAGQKDIKAAYRRLAQQYHPDTDSGDAAAERWEEIQWAYAVLSDPVRRAGYDVQMPSDQFDGRREGEDSPEKAAPRKPSSTNVCVVLAAALTAICLICLGAGLAIPLLSERLESALPTATFTPDAALQARQTAIHQAALETLGLAESWPRVFSDDFAQNKDEWFLGRDEGQYALMNWAITEGVYHWEMEAFQSFIWYVYPEREAVSDFYLSVEAQQISGHESGNYGLLLRYLDDDNYYYFEIRPQFQYFRFRILLRGQWGAVQEYTFSSSIHPTEINRITVVAQGPRFYFFINDQFVGEAREDRIPTGILGLVAGADEAGAESVVEFDNYEMRAPAQEATPTP